MRLDRFVSQASGLSRAEARRLARKGQISLAGETLRDPARHVHASDAVQLRGEVLRLPEEHYIMLHKPAGLICATRDAAQATVMQLLPAELAERLHIVGRLDRDSTGLLLLTTDGDWSHRVTAPRRHCRKSYRVELAAELPPGAADSLRAGLLLRGEKKPTRPAAVEVLGVRSIRLTIDEGRYHQVKRMLGAVGNLVTALHREAIGGLPLDGRLAPGSWRHLDAQERESVFAPPA